MNANYRRATGYRLEEVGLRPRGNTVTVDVPSDNPFEDEELAGAPVTVVTQASGGVAKPQRGQRSQKLMYGGPKKGIPAAAIKVAIQRKNAARPQRVIEAHGAGIFGLAGDISARPTYAVAPTKRMGGFMPGMGDLGEISEAAYMVALREVKMPIDTTNEATRTESYAKRQAAQEVVDAYKKEQEDKKPGWGSRFWSGLKEGVSAGVDVAKTAVAQQQAKTEKAKAEAEARKAGYQAQAVTAGAMSQQQAAEAAARAKTSSTKWLVGGGIAVVALGVLAFVLLKPKAK